jgi:hypothetical protein
VRMGKASTSWQRQWWQRERIENHGVDEDGRTSMHFDRYWARNEGGTRTIPGIRQLQSQLRWSDAAAVP